MQFHEFLEGLYSRALAWWTDNEEWQEWMILMNKKRQWWRIERKLCTEYFKGISRIDKTQQAVFYSLRHNIPSLKSIICSLNSFQRGIWVPCRLSRKKQEKEVGDRVIICSLNSSMVFMSIFFQLFLNSFLVLFLFYFLMSWKFYIHEPE